MDETLKVLPNFKKFKDYIQDINKNISPIVLSGLTDTAKVHMAYATSFYTKKPICIITYNEIQARNLIKDLRYFNEDICFFPKKEIVTYDYIAESKDLKYERIDTLNKIYEKKENIIVTTIESISQKIISKDELYKNILVFEKDKTYDLEEVKEKLIKLGYERYDLIEGRGQFGIRGGILDIAISNKIGARIEFWGDEIDSIRNFDISTGRSTGEIKKTIIYPSHEYLLEDNIEEIIKSIEKRDYTKEQRQLVDEDIEQIRGGNVLSKIDRYFNSFYKNQETLLSYLNNNYIVFLDEIGKIKNRITNIKRDNDNIIESLIEKHKIIPDVISLSNYIDMIEKVERNQTVYLQRQDLGFIDTQNMHAKRNGYSFGYREVNFFRSSMDIFFQEVQKAEKDKKRVIILGGSKRNCENLSKLLNEKNIANIYIKDKKDINLEKSDYSKLVFVTPGALTTGFESYDFNLIVISAEEFFKTEQRKKKVSNTFKESQKVIFSDLSEGNYVVHKYHGIGQYIGVNTITADNITKDYIKIKYKDDDILYIPTNQLDNIRKYIGVGEKNPKINRLGSKEWQNTKNKVKQNLREVAKELIELYAKREKIKGYAFSNDTPWQKEFEDKFPYVETDDQIRCIKESKRDMEHSRPMERLLCGDVGYGKTEVAIRLAFKACMDQRQVAYLVPTTILANQQYEYFKGRMSEFAIKVELLNRFRTRKEQQEIVKKLKLGEIDVIIGTHRILSKDVIFKDLGLLIIDEEHRFGVKDKERIKQLKTAVDVLSMTATPIPRTLHMSIVGIRDMSVIYEPPQNRRPVQTYVLEYDEDVIKEAIIKELEREGQVFYLFNNVEGIQRKVSYIQDLVPEAKIGYAHGKMTGKELEQIMIDFIDKKINVLICTTILESGIDIPNANTIIVENSDRLGLAQLYQIRGRVGRSDLQAYAYITYKPDRLLKEFAEKRLKAIKEFTEFGSGFKIALRDLEIRGAGSLLGEIQHGHLDGVGYDTYCKLLDEVVKEIQGIEIDEEQEELLIDLNVSSYIPAHYIQNNNQKIELYQNISLCKTDKDIDDMIEEIKDKYGKIPKEVLNLVEVIRIKNLGKSANITKIIQRESNIIFNFNSKKFNMCIVDKLIKIYKSNIRFSPITDPYISYKLKSLNQDDILKEVKSFLENINKD